MAMKVTGRNTSQHSVYALFKAQQIHLGMRVNQAVSDGCLPVVSAIDAVDLLPLP